MANKRRCLRGTAPLVVLGSAQEAQGVPQVTVDEKHMQRSLRIFHGMLDPQQVGVEGVRGSLVPPGPTRRGHGPEGQGVDVVALDLPDAGPHVGICPVTPVRPAGPVQREPDDVLLRLVGADVAACPQPLEDRDTRALKAYDKEYLGDTLLQKPRDAGLVLP
eukprot:CAMPEP_0179224900 /NCGR_PEP_ID=MMETSP0797-20121207/8032_1 /TAXON_ID=47934 /ORGANISM="Dinophysis acuminata, Strain DAEP01" /LENGTH=161 /DNA_ID=CAMNT_0020931903 /DNA_START=404 /DNA_END=889 /DNA_ORIENTATION=+